MARLIRNTRIAFFFTALAALSLRSGVACKATTDHANFDVGGGNAASSNASAGAGGSIGIGIDGGQGGAGQSGGIPQTCGEALKNQSYIGCEYWPTVTPNSSLYVGFPFAIAAANPTGSPATVTVTRAGQTVAQTVVQPGQLQTMKLPWVSELLQTDATGSGATFASAIVKGGGYKVVSSVPITLYQFSPLDFELANAPADCPSPIGTTGCFSYTNDASILLPTSALRNEYYAMAYPTLHLGSDQGFGQITWTDIPGFVTVTATQDGTQVTVSSTAHVRGGSGVAQLAPGQKGVYQLDAGDVLLLETDNPPGQQTPVGGKQCLTDPNSGSIECPTAPEYDLTGSHIVTTKPVSVIGGHDCTFVPYDVYACDHMEESIFPVETLGKDLIVTAPQTVTAAIANSTLSVPDSMFVRVLSAVDGNKITFDPPVAPNTTLNAGQWVEIGPTKQDFRVQADNKILVGQYMVGENFSGAAVGGGDPSESIAIPTEQYRLEYSFLAPSSYTYNLVNVVAPVGATVRIDGAAIPSGTFSPIGSSGMAVARHQIAGGTHQMDGDKNFGIVVYGYGSYTSYMYPGGLNLETITITPK